MPSNLPARLVLTTKRRSLRPLISVAWAADWLVAEDILMLGGESRSKGFVTDKELDRAFSLAFSLAFFFFFGVWLRKTGGDLSVEEICTRGFYSPL